jgi:hypothetical protein
MLCVLRKVCMRLLWFRMNEGKVSIWNGFGIKAKAKGRDTYTPSFFIGFMYDVVS